MLTVVSPPSSDRAASRAGGSTRLNDRSPASTPTASRAELNHVVFGAHSVIPQVLGGALTGASAPASAPTSVMTPENKAVLITTAEPTVAPRACAEPLDLDGHRRPRVLVIDTGLRTASNGKENEPEHAFLRSPTGANPAVHLHKRWQSNPTSTPIDDEDEPDDDRSGLLDFEAGHGTFITGIVRQICPGRRDPPGRRAVELRRGPYARVRSTIRRMTESCGPFDVVVMSFGTYCADDDPGPARLAICRRCSATPSVSPPPGTCSPAARTSRPRCRTSSLSAGSTVPARRGSPTSAAGSTPARRRSTSSARSSTTSPSAHRRFDRGAASVSGHAGAGRASPRRRSPGRSPRRCTSARSLRQEAWRRLSSPASADAGSRGRRQRLDRRRVTRLAG